jgi:hypothetical protein
MFCIINHKKEGNMYKVSSDDVKIIIGFSPNNKEKIYGLAAMIRAHEQGIKGVTVGKNPMLDFPLISQVTKQKRMPELIDKLTILLSKITGEEKSFFKPVESSHNGEVIRLLGENVTVFRRAMFEFATNYVDFDNWTEKTVECIKKDSANKEQFALSILLLQDTMNVGFLKTTEDRGIPEKKAVIATPITIRNLQMDATHPPALRSPAVER